jgi:predicted transcriptional regulator of viral defense system
MNDITAPNYISLYALASAQAGYFTTKQARAHGVSWRALTHHAHSGRFQRVRRGLYRFRDYPSSPREDVVAAWLAVGAERSVVSHETALDIYDLTDLIPSAVHLTVPRAQRGLRPPAGVQLHTTLQPVREDEVTIREGMRLTTPERTLLDTAEAGTAPDQVERGILTAIKRGWVTPAQLRDHAAERGGRVAALITAAMQASAESVP